MSEEKKTIEYEVKTTKPWWLFFAWAYTKTFKGDEEAEKLVDKHIKAQVGNCEINN